MNCPVCGSDIPSGVKYCPVCGTDVEEVQLRSQQASSRTAPTQQMPPQYEPRQPQPQAQVPANPMAQQRAVPMNPSAPPQEAGTRGFDTSKMASAPKWPIVLICILAIAVVVLVVLLVVRGCDTPAPVAPDTTNPPVQTPATSPETDANTPSVGDQTVVPATSGALDNTAAYDQLTAAYDQLGAYADRIQAVVDYCNNRDETDAAGLQAEIDSARALQAEIAAQGDALNAMQLSDDSPYAGTLANLKTLNVDLAGRIGDLVDGMQQWANGEEATAFSRHNENGQSTYKSEFEALYPNSRPVQQ